MIQIDSRVRIPQAALPEVFARLKASGDPLAFVDTPRADAAEDITEHLIAHRWLPDFDDAGDLCDLNFTGEKRGDEMALFSLLAPYVDAGSQIIVAVEDEGVFGFFFDGRRCHLRQAELAFSP